MHCCLLVFVKYSWRVCVWVFFLPPTSNVTPLPAITPTLHMYDIASGIIKFNKQQSININYNSRRASRVKTRRKQTSLPTNYPYSSLTPSPQFNSYYGGNRDKSHLLFPQRKGPHVHHHISSRGFFHAHSVQSNSTTHRRCYLRLQGGAGE